MIQSGCEFMKCEYADRDMDNNPVCKYERKRCRYRGVEDDEVQAEIEKLKADHEAAMKEKEREIAIRDRAVERRNQAIDRLIGQRKQIEADNADLLKKLEEAKGEIERIKGSLDNVTFNAKKNTEFYEKEVADLRAKLAAAEKRIAECHDWYCGCGHWNGANLSHCAMCNRTPIDSIEALKEADHAD